MSKITIKNEFRRDERFEVTDSDHSLSSAKPTIAEGARILNISRSGFAMTVPGELRGGPSFSLNFIRNGLTKNIASRLIWKQPLSSGGPGWSVGAEFDLAMGQSFEIDELMASLSQTFQQSRELENKLGKKVCRRCILTEKIPNISFDEEGICNYCRKYEKEESASQQKRDFVQLEENLLKLLKNKKRGSEYDCLCLFSGGKDSTYMLYQLVHKYKLRVLAFTFDNYFIAPETFRNMNKVLSKLNVDHVLFKPSWSANKSIFQAGMKNSEKSKDSNELAYMIGHACWPCFTQISMHSIKLAVDKGIPAIVVGTTPGQIRQKKYDMVSKYNGLVDVYKSMILPMLNLLKITGQAESRKSLELSLFKQLKVLKMRLVPFYEYVLYNEEEVIKTVKDKLGWESPNSTDSCSTNCHLNSLGIQVHKEKHGISPYVVPLSRDVREGVVRRSDALRAVTSELNQNLVKNIAGQLDVQINLS